MNIIKKTLVIALMALAPVLASAQIFEKAAQRMEIATVETDEDDFITSSYSVFRMQDSGRIWLSVGHLGIGSDLIQLQFDPVYELFIPLGDTLEEAVKTLQELQAFSKEPRLSTKEVQGCLAAITPNDELEPVTLTSRRLLTSKIVSFSVMRDDLVRATYLTKSDLGSLVFSTKAYRKLHPTEQ